MRKNYNKNDNHEAEQFFSEYLNNTISSLNLGFAVFFIFSIILIFLVNLFGENLIKFDDNFKLILLNNTLIMTIFVLLGFYSLSKKSFGLFISYISYLILLDFNIFFNYIPLSGNYFYSSNNTILNASNIFYNMLIILTNIFLLSYTIYFFLFQYGYLNSNTDLDFQPLGSMINEIRLKADMLKMSINSFLINTQLYKYLPYLLFKKDDLYFMNVESEIDSTEDSMIDSKFSKINKINISNSSDYMNSKSTIDVEY